MLKDGQYRYRYRLFGWCQWCSSNYDPRMPAERRQPATFDIDVAAPIAERGADHPVVGMAPVPCPYCGSRQTEIRILGAQKVPDPPPALAPAGAPAASAPG